jgi:photosystem II stability/assembly factor-like uncharacterized protein
MAAMRMWTSFAALVAAAASAGCSASASATGAHGDGGATSDGSTAPLLADAATDAPVDASKGDTGTMSAVAPCSNVSGAVGQWQNISPPAFTTPSNMEVLAVVVNPADDTVFAAAGNVTNGGACPSGATCPSAGTGVYKSSDCGATWARVSDTTAGTDSANLLTGDPWAMLIDPVDPQTLYINNGYGTNPTIYKSTNGGVDWTALDPDPTHQISSGVFVQAIAMDPYDHTHLAVTFHVGCGASSPYSWCFSRSTDAGNTWTIFDGPKSIPNWTVPDSGWIEASSISILGPSSYLVLSPDGVWYTGDGGGTWTLVVAQIDETSYAGSTHILPDGTLYIGDSPGSIFYSSAAPSESPPFALYQAPTLPVPQPRLPYQTGLSPAVMPLTGSPQVTQIIDDGVSLFASNNLGQNAPFWTAPLANTTAWTQMPDMICANGTCRGSNELGYDSVNHIVYSANWGAGLWRLVTR